MSRVDELVPEHIRNLNGYAPGKPIQQAERESGVRCIKMASNENPFGPSPLAVAAMREASAGASFYPDNEASELRLLIAERHRIPAEQVLITAGSTSFIDIAARTLLAPGRNAVTSERSFIVYPIATEATGARLVQVAMRGDSYDLDAMLAAMNRDTRIVFVANPNNPTGTLIPPADMERFLDLLPAHVLLVLDEAYADFAQHFAEQRGVEYSRSLDWVRQGRRLIVLRTFSKAQGLAGMRVGYGFGPAELIHYFGRVRVAFSMTSVSEAAAVAALNDERHIRMTLENNAREARSLTRALSDFGFRVVPTWANFLYVDVAEDAALVARRLQAEGIIVRPLTAWGARSAIRVTIGTPEQNRLFLSALKRVMEHATV